MLIIDAEGHDAAILRSMVAHGRAEERQGRNAWPYVVQFETMGHCDKLANKSAEWEAIGLLEMAGYTLVAYSHYNSQLVHREAWRIPRIKKWASAMRCDYCHKRRAYPYIFSRTRRGKWSTCCSPCLEKKPS